MRNFEKLIVMLLVSIWSVGATPIEIKEQSSGSLSVEVRSNELEIKDVSLTDGVYQAIRMKDFGLTMVPGEPQLPLVTIRIATSNAESLIWNVSSEGQELKEGVLVQPSEFPTFDAHKIRQKSRFRKVDDIYSANSFYPESPVEVISVQKLHGIDIVTVEIKPVRTNPVAKSLELTQKLSVNFTFDAPKVDKGTRSENVRQIKSGVINGDEISVPKPRALNDDEDDILIITIPTYEPAAEKLAVWHKKKGYDVKIVAKSSWTTSTVQQEIANFYNSGSVKPGYFLIIGSQDDVPAESKESLFTGYGEDYHLSDNFYACMDGGSDYTPEMARGRLLVSSLQEANDIVDKIISYEMTPPSDDNFYTNALSCSFFQSYNTSQDENSDPLTADRRFVQTVEEILNYLDDNYEIHSDRIYCAEADINPTYWNDGWYSWGEDVPQHLKRPGFKWDGDYQDIAQGINDGAFLVYHYDHGYESGWGDPAFSSNNVKQLLSNGELLPLIFSIDCLVGKFNATNYYGNPMECFAEVVTKKNDGGAIGIVAATTLSSSGNNEALLMGMIDAVWPGLVLKTPAMPNPNVQTHEPMYNFGDIMNQGFFRMTETWPYNNEPHYSMYHLIGDPTTPLWTDIPQNVTGSIEKVLGNEEESFDITDCNVTSGMATLYSSKLDKVVGKTVIEGHGNVSIPVALAGVSVDDTLELTITGQNFRPRLEKVVVKEGTAVIGTSTFINAASVSIEKGVISITIPAKATIDAAIYSIQGKRIENISYTNSLASDHVLQTKGALSSGVYFLKGTLNGSSIIREFSIN